MISEQQYARLATSLADPGYAPAPEISVEQIEVDHLLATLARNRTPLIAIQPTQGDWQRALLDQPAFRKAQAAERFIYDNLHWEYVAAKKLWQAAGIEDILIKSAGRFPSFPYRSSNLDTLVRLADGDRARQLLRAHGYVELRNVEENQKYLFRRFHRGEEMIGLHVHTHVGWYASFLDEESLWQRRRPSPDDPAVTIPSPEDILLVTLAHAFYEDKCIKVSDLGKTHQCLRAASRFDWEYVERVAELRDWPDGLAVALLVCAHLGRAWYGESPIPPEVLARAERLLAGARLRAVRRHLQSEPTRAPFRLPFALSKYYFYRRLWHDRQKNALGRLADLFIHTMQGTKLRLRLHSQPGTLICFSGLDGCGKTAHAHALQKAFAGCHIRTRYVWSRSGSSRFVAGFIGLAKLLAGTKRAETEVEANPEAEAERRRAQFRRPLVRAAWSWLTALDLASQYLWRVRLPLLLGQVVICDRYVYDTWVEWGVYFGLGERIKGMAAARWLRWLAPRPQVVYLLDLPAEAAKSRSSSSPALGLMAEQRNVYLALADEFDVRIEDAQRPSGMVQDEIAYRTLTAYFDRYWTLVNALFFRNPRPMPAIYFQPNPDAKG
jgi:dTMP kinase